MSYSLVSVTDWDDVLSEVASFANSDGWTVVYDQPGQIGVESGNCHIALGTRSGENPISRSGGFTDGIIHGGLSTSLNSGSPYQYWGHPGSLVTTETDSDRLQFNDIHDSLSNLWLFSGDGVSDPDYIHAVLQTAGDRYTCFSFGLLDKLGQTHADVAFAAGMYWDFWTGHPVSNDISDSAHRVGYCMDELNMHFYVPSGVLPSGYDLIAGAVEEGLNYVTECLTRVNQASDHWASSSGKILDFFMAVDNQLTTGGTHLLGLPVFISEVSGGTSHCHVGNFPGITLCNIENLTPSQVIQFGSEEWVVFPWKRKGLEDNLSSGGDPQDPANTAGYGWAFKKNT